MHPLATFPALLTFALVSPVLLRLAGTAFVIYIGKERYKKSNNWLAFVYGFVAGMLVLGAYTQIAAILGIIIAKAEFWISRGSTPTSKEKLLLYVLGIIILLSLLFTGPGFWAFDLPL